MTWFRLYFVIWIKQHWLQHQHLCKHTLSALCDHLDSTFSGDGQHLLRLLSSSALAESILGEFQHFSITSFVCLNETNCVLIKKRSSFYYRIKALNITLNLYYQLGGKMQHSRVLTQQILSEIWNIKSPIFALLHLRNYMLSTPFLKRKNLEIFLICVGHEKQVLAGK